MRRRVVGSLIIAAILVLTMTVAYLSRVASILVAYKAKQLCSGVFVAGRDPAAVERDLEADDLAILAYVDGTVDAAARSATAGFAAITRAAVYRDSVGCALLVHPAVTAVAPAGRGPAASTASARSALDRAGALPVAPVGRVMTVVDRAFEEPDGARPRRTRAVVVLRGGRIVAERYADGMTADTPLLGWSMTKSVMNALTGILVRDGRWSLDMALPIPEWQAAGDARRGITLDHVLRMSSGLAFDDAMTFPLPDVLTMLLASDDMAAFAIGKPLEAPPGTRWQYSSGTSVVLARAMRHAFAGPAEYEAFPQRALFGPLGMTSAIIETDAAGTFVGSSLMFATARDWARFGLLYLRDGVWNGVRILPEGWVEYTRTPAPADSSRRYGAHFWLDVADGYGKSRTPLPADAFHAAGHQGQFVTIVPSRDVVVVRLGATRYRDAWDQAAFVGEVLGVLERE